MNTLDYFFEKYQLSKEEISILKDYAEGHDLELVVHYGQIKLMDLQDKNSYWASGMLDVVSTISGFNESLLEQEVSEPKYEKDKEILDKLYNKVREIKTKRQDRYILKLYYSTGDVLETAINGPIELINQYYLIGEDYNIGNYGDKIATLEDVEFCVDCGNGMTLFIMSNGLMTDEIMDNIKNTESAIYWSDSRLKHWMFDTKVSEHVWLETLEISPDLKNFKMNLYV